MPPLTRPLLVFFFFSSSFFFFFSVVASSSYSLSLPLTSLPLRSPSISTTKQTLVATSSSSGGYNFKATFKYSMALVVSLPIGTPPQAQDMVLDTGSQLSWIQCNKTKTTSTRPQNRQPNKPTTSSFDPSLSSSFSELPCSHPLCKPRIPDYTLPTSCDQNRLCHYSYFYADGTLAEGNLVREKFTFSPSQITPPLILGCAQGGSDEKGILGMNLGRLSFPSQAKIGKFSYCVPVRSTRVGPATGSFYLGENPNSKGFQYVGLLTFTQSQRMPNLDPLAYTVPMQGIRIGSTKLKIPVSVFRPDPSGSGQTFVDSGSEFTYLVDEAYDKVRQEVVRLVGPKMKKGYTYAGVADMCFDRVNAAGIGRLIGDLAFEFEKGVEIVVGRDHMLSDVGGGVYCVGIGRSEMLGAASNIIGNVHQQNLWVEFDLASRRIGFGRADCSRS